MASASSMASGIRRPLGRPIPPQGRGKLPARHFGCLGRTRVHTQATQPFPRKVNRTRLTETIQPFQKVGAFRRASSLRPGPRTAFAPCR